MGLQEGENEGKSSRDEVVSGCELTGFTAKRKNRERSEGPTTQRVKRRIVHTGSTPRSIGTSMPLGRGVCISRELLSTGSALSNKCG